MHEDEDNLDYEPVCLSEDEEEVIGYVRRREFESGQNPGGWSAYSLGRRGKFVCSTRDEAVQLLRAPILNRRLAREAVQTMKRGEWS